MKKVRFSNFLPIIFAAPPIILGAIVMKLHKVALINIGLNIACLLICGFISTFMTLRKEKEKSMKAGFITIVIAVILLFLTFISEGMSGVHRWISIGPIRFYVASIILPLVIIKLWSLLEDDKLWLTMIIAAAIAFLLLIQPDAAQLTAFVIPMIILFWNKARSGAFRFSFSILFLAMAVASWICLDSLPPVSYVEEIMNLAASMGSMWLILGVISIIMLPVPFILFPKKNYNLLSWCIGIYFITYLLSTQFGNFPIPLMGYGVSPIIGYFIAATWVAKDQA